ncbi:MAG: GIY-YIG nuclease family protein [Bacteroidales bacterium]|nr:GIY-YIG nuclease family protein [Bacteroidales bacterium]
MYKSYYTYIMSSNNNAVLYIGVTGDLTKRVLEHKSGKGSYFTSKYHCHKLVYYETFSDITQAIAREKEMKGWIRAKKDALIDTINPKRIDLGP